jgi:hypothetical protein
MWNDGLDVCWATAEVFAREIGIVCLLRHSIDVVVPVEGFIIIIIYFFR